MKKENAAKLTTLDENEELTIEERQFDALLTALRKATSNCALECTPCAAVRVIRNTAPTLAERRLLPGGSKCGQGAAKGADLLVALILHREELEACRIHWRLLLHESRSMWNSTLQIWRTGQPHGDMHYTEYEPNDNRLWNWISRRYPQLMD